MRVSIGLLALLALAGACAAPDGSGRKGRVIETTLASTVQLFAERDGGVTRAGSGVVLAIEPNAGTSLVVTTAHMLEPPVEQTVYAVSPVRREPLAATILALDEETDLALLQVEGFGFQAAALKEDGADLGDEVWVVAFPWGRERTVVSGVVSQVAWPEPETLTRPPVHGPVRLIDASVSYGMSGGGVFSRATGELLGVVRGYRSAQLSFPEAAGGSLTLPVAGETTVVSAAEILCFLGRVAPRERLPAPLGASAGC